MSNSYAPVVYGPVVVAQPVVPVEPVGQWQWDGICANHSGNLFCCGAPEGQKCTGWCDPIFCDILWCFPCQIARQYQALGLRGEAKANEQPCDVVLGILGGLCCGACLQTCTGVPFPKMISIFLTWRVLDMTQKQFGLRTKDTSKGGCDCCCDCGNFCSAFWCGPCMLTHSHKELSVRGIYPGVCCCGRQYTCCAMPDPEAGPPGYTGAAAMGYPTDAADYEVSQPVVGQVLSDSQMMPPLPKDEPPIPPPVPSAPSAPPTMAIE